MKLVRMVMDLEAKVDYLLTEIQELKMHAYALEDQNEQLREKLFAKQEEGVAFENLAKLYEEGFHICHAHFGQFRAKEEDCLFCLDFIRKDGVGRGGKGDEGTA
ncbi:MAG: initiation control protein YabA [Bacillota bacterium]